MSIQIGDSIPAATLAYMGAKGPKTISTEELCKGKKIVLFALPGAFTPTCSASHLPGFVVKADDILAKGVDRIVCLSVNDAFVMGAWGTQQNVEDDKIMMASDGSAELTLAMGLQLDLTERQFGIRSQRYAMIIDNGVVSALNVEEGGAFEVSSAEAVLELL